MVLVISEPEASNLATSTITRGTQTADEVWLASESDSDEDKAEIERLAKLITKARASKKRVMKCKDKLAAFTAKQERKIEVRCVEGASKLDSEVQQVLGCLGYELKPSPI